VSAACFGSGTVMMGYPMALRSELGVAVVGISVGLSLAVRLKKARAVARTDTVKASGGYEFDKCVIDGVSNKFQLIDRLKCILFPVALI
jgi:hypothetical protein